MHRNMVINCLSQLNFILWLDCLLREVRSAKLNVILADLNISISLLLGLHMGTKYIPTFSENLYHNSYFPLRTNILSR